MSKYKLQRGFAHLALLILVLLVLAIAFVGYKVVQNRADKNKSNTTSTAVTQNSAGTINSKADINNAVNTINSENVDSDLNPSQLDSDISVLL